ncbi:MAG TPA: ATP-binding cassette domain-containing protein [Ohtaekwangia sp.]|nr:ATP-binding cassette domain-containing protein [Ohtaekwangia sp.]
MIKLNNVTISRNGIALFEKLNWSIEKHEHWVIRGENGAGKTLLLEILAGMITPIEGNIEYDFIHETDWTARYNERKQKIHYIPAHALQIFLTSYHDLFYQQRYYSMDESAIPLVRDILGDDIKSLKRFDFPPNLNIDGLLELEITRLSNGQLKKVLLLKNLLKEIPRVILFDYPFEGLDQDSRKDLINLIDHFANTFAIQIVLTDHHHDLPKVINRTLILKDFKIQPTGPIEPSSSIIPGTLNHKEGNQNEDTSPPVVEMKNLTIAYKGKKIINNLNWTIRKGERWALTGKNGSGKTTLFSLIYADHPMAYSQQIYLFGKRRGTGESIWDIKKRMTYFGPEQIHFLNPGAVLHTARKLIMQQQHNDNEERLKQLIRFFNADTFMDKPVRQLSSGELQCMLLINSFISDKELLLLDEPFQFLDPVRKELVNRYLHHVLHEDSTLILITHYEEDVAMWTQHRMNLEPQST